MIDDQPFSRHLLFAVLVLVLVVIMLFFGLKSERWHVANNVHWIPDNSVLKIGNPGMAYVDDAFSLKDIKPKGDFTIHIGLSVEKSNRSGFRPILMLHDGDDHIQLAVWQWKSSVIVMNGDDYDHKKKWPRLTAVDVLTVDELSLITIAVSNGGSRLLVNGSIASENTNWKFTIPDSGGKLRLVLGNSVYGKHGWEGQIHGLAIYKRGFSSAEAGYYFAHWLNGKGFPSESDTDLLLLFTFREGGGGLIFDQSSNSQSMHLPATPIQFEKNFLQPPHYSFTLNRGFFIDTIINLFGFIPFGAVLYCWLLNWQWLQLKSRVFTVVLFSFCLSLSIEIFQGWLPDRSSSLLDLSLNTAGGWIGTQIGIKYKNLKWFGKKADLRSSSQNN
ncbi:MAG: VanZ family protein [Desulforhopalus sp.]